MLLEGKMSLRLAGSPFHAQATLKLSAASDSAQRKEPWSNFSYTSGSGVVAVPCRAISAVRMHPGRDNPSFEIEYVSSPEAEAAKKKGSGGVLVRMRVWPASQEPLDESPEP